VIVIRHSDVLGVPGNVDVLCWAGMRQATSHHVVGVVAFEKSRRGHFVDVFNWNCTMLTLNPRDGMHYKIGIILPVVSDEIGNLLSPCCS